MVYVISQNSPAVILFRAPGDFDLDAYLANDLESAIASGSVVYSKIPWEWIVDGVEVCNLSEATRNKRLHTDVDARIRRILGQGAGTQSLPQAGRRGHCERRIRPICGYQ